MNTSLLVGILLLFHCWVGYPALMMVMAVVHRPRQRTPDPSTLSVTVMIAACNEAENIEARIRNILECRWTGPDLQVLIVSDGSTDQTAQLVRGLAAEDNRIRLLELSPQRGRANAHNEGTLISQGEVIVFSDAETQFEPDFLNRIVAPFDDPSVGFTSGALEYVNDQDGIARSSGIYWRQEQMLRRAESACGVFLLGSGACCAVRRGLFRPIPPTGDVDFTTPLDVVLQGARCVHCPDAIARDRLPDTGGREFRARIRMTSKNLRGTLARWGLAGLLRHPIYSLVLLSHKILKWLTPFLLLAVAGVAVASASDSMPARVVLGCQGLFLVLAILGRVCPRLPVAGHAWNFVLVNIAFGIGVGKALFGAVPAMYRPVSQSAR